jgi:hypothetical protein
MNENEDEDPIGKALGVSPIDSTSKAVSTIIAEAHDDSAKTDFETARANMQEVITQGLQSLSELAKVADQSQNPRAYEVLFKGMDTLVVANEKMLELQKKIREIGGIESPMNDQAKTINNNLFVGSTSELQKMIENIKKNDNP